jgi:hypothetical protein
MLLLWKHLAQAQLVRLGPMEFQAPEMADALWVVDGQQRISTLAATVLVTRDHAAFRSFVAYFDLDKRQFVGHSSAGRDSRRWLPVHRAFDPNDLQEWVLENVARDLERRRLAFEVGTALRDFEIPAIVVEADDERELRQIFDRVNTAGRRLRRDEVFRALHEGFGGGAPDTADSVSTQIRELGRGGIPDTWVQRTAEVLANIDPTRKRNATDREPGRHAEILRETLDPLRRVVEFLADDAWIPRTELVPYFWVMPVLARLFHRFPNLHERNRALLARWLWRGALSGQHSSNTSPAFRAMIRAANVEGESNAVQNLLRLTPRQRPADPEAVDKIVLAPLRGLNAGARMAVCAFMWTSPTELESPRALDLSELLSDDPEVAKPGDLLAHALINSPRLVPAAPGLPAGLANYLLGATAEMRGLGGLVDLKPDQVEAMAEALRGHGFTSESLGAFVAGRPADALALRAQELASRARRFFEARARWEDPDRDRPPLLDDLESGE